ncbi:hypothetical protein ACFL5G_02085 [Candidatus Margulisiibacteriota bacterium]
MKKFILILIVLLLIPCSLQAKVSFGVGLNWIGQSGMGMGFDLGVGWQKFGFDLAHYGVQPTLYRFGTVSVNHDRLGIYYQPIEFLMFQTGLHAVHLNLSDDKQEVLGAKDSSSWTGPYLIISVPIRLEETYYIRPFWGILSVAEGARTEVAYGIALSAEFETRQEKIFF